jgi:exonuclease 3'-5' domain-containing protein 1
MVLSLVSLVARLCLLQVSTGTKTFIFDVCALGEQVFSCGLKEILESERIIKVFHDCRYDSDALWWLYGIRLRNVLDTQVAFRILRCGVYYNFSPSIVTFL